MTLLTVVTEQFLIRQEKIGWKGYLNTGDPEEFTQGILEGRELVLITARFMIDKQKHLNTVVH